MKKSKMITVAILACALMLGSCIDDKESASVESIRTAKVKQLEALANYNNAQAEAALISAKADAMVKEAEAASKNQTTEEQKQAFGIKLEQLKEEANLAVAKAKLAAQEAEQSMKENAEEHIQMLFGNYQLANTTLATLNDNLFKEQVALISAQADLADWKVIKTDDIVGYRTEIAKQESIKKALKALKPNDIKAAKDAAKANETAKKGIDDRMAVANSKYNEAKNAYSNTVDAIAETVTAMQGKFLVDNYPTFVKVVAVTPKDINGKTASKAYDTYIAHDKLISAELIRLKETSNTYDDQLGKADGSETGTLNYALVEAQKAEKEAQTEAGKTGASPADREKYAQAMEATHAAKAAVDKAKEDKAKSLEDYNKLVAAQAAFTEEGQKTYIAAIAIAEAAAVIEISANNAKTPISDELALNAATQTVLDALANGLTDIEKEVSACDVAISAQQKLITIAEGISDKDQLVAYTNEKIANLKAEIGNQQLIVTNFKAKLDAALAIK